MTKLIEIKMANKPSLPVRISHKTKGKTMILYRDRMLGIVQNRSAVVVGKAVSIFLQFNSILFEETNADEPANC